jgi:hypothetical protein
VTARWHLPLRRTVMLVLLSTTIFATSASSPSPIQSEASAALRQVVAAGQLAELRWPNFSDYQVYLKNFYEPSGYALAWIHDGTTTPQARTLIAALRKQATKVCVPKTTTGRSGLIASQVFSTFLRRLPRHISTQPSLFV